ncbi:hypothetical protein chiPu_0018062 [Chiloscyllium punctatum]|uniref:Uncharacterized protein n=1 Tax=Chiloscyllium punctatum TaxID=137246 RepID=A0A401RKS1_CHIPU|nr:hypothetical protein [Chiloscyllium punctatum]
MEVVEAVLNFYCRTTMVDDKISGVAVFYRRKPVITREEVKEDIFLMDQSEEQQEAKTLPVEETTPDEEDINSRNRINEFIMALKLCIRIMDVPPPKDCSSSRKQLSSTFSRLLEERNRKVWCEPQY